MISAEAAAGYFTTHLLGELYLEADAAKQNAALAMANADIAAELGGIEPVDAECFGLAAVCEQVLFLLTGCGELAGERADLADEKIEGLGSRSFAAGKDRTLAPRARRYLSWYRPSASVNIRRG